MRYTVAEKETHTARMELPNEVMVEEVRRLLAEGHTVTLRAKGNSMLPFIVGGRDCVVLQRCANPRPGDIVLAQLPSGGYVLHRIHRISGDSVTLMGDGNVRGCEQCALSHVIARVETILHDGRTISCDAPSERRKARLWRWLLPIRRYLLAVYRRINSL